MCVLQRSKTFGNERDVEVKVYAPGKGYGASVVDSVSLPLVRRGFELKMINPAVNSVLGGNRLVLEGFGFMEGYPDRHSVVLNQLDADSLVEYNQLLVALGFDSKTKVPDQYQINCVVKEVNLDMIFGTIFDEICSVNLRDKAIQSYGYKGVNKRDTILGLRWLKNDKNHLFVSSTGLGKVYH